MESSNNRRIWPLALAGLAAIGIYAYSAIDIEPDPTSSLPAGGVAELESLADRDDLNVLFILVDTLRAARMSAYGYQRATTPFIAGLAERGIRFDRHIAQSSWTKSSMASLWSSMLPTRVGITRFDQTIASGVKMPAEVLAEEGFKTVGLYRNGWVSPYFGFDQGFEKYYRPVGGGADPNIARMRPNAQVHGSDEALVADATEFLRIHGKTSRWFLYLHLMDLHEYTYDQESAVFGNAVADIYDNSILRTDWLISTLHGYLAKSGLLEKTLIVLVSDHGEAFGERGFEGHAREVFPETTETPWIILPPFALDPGVVVETRTDNVDVWPTILDVLGLPSLGNGIDGRSRRDAILAAVQGKQSENGPDERSIAFLDESWGTPGTKRTVAVSIVEGKYRYVSGTSLNGRAFEVLLSSDDAQTEDHATEQPDLVARLREAAEAVKAQEPAFESEVIKLDEMQLDQLRALGYELP